MRNLLSALDLGAAEAAVTQAARIAVAWALQRIASRLIQGFHAYMAGRVRADELTRMATVGRVLRYTATVVIGVLAGTLVLGELGISVAPILATAGIAGIAVGFGAQSLIKDYFSAGSPGAWCCAAG
ncbi:MAG TPA: hypothetical protein VFR66_03230 [Burkholderiales bacterium]|nr:hypothetical protein [Burkholderiales bacterium]